MLTCKASRKGRAPGDTRREGTHGALRGRQAGKQTLSMGSVHAVVTDTNREGGDTGERRSKSTPEGTGGRARAMPPGDRRAE